MFETIEWKETHVCLIDQTRLPQELVYRDCETVEDVWDAIKRLQVRGAPAIGIAGAYGLYLAVKDYDNDQDMSAFWIFFEERLSYLVECRPTAVNLEWALRRCHDKVREVNDLARVKAILLKEAHAIHKEDKALCQRIGQFGSELLDEQSVVLTHCNAGALATGGAGTALSVMYEAQKQGKHLKIFADETRPLLQGSRLTAWELSQAGIDVTVIADNMAAHVIRDKGVNAIIVGADRIVANGDVANKIGTYNLAVLAEKHHIPFYVAAPFSTFDTSLSSGKSIPIEERESHEIVHGFGNQTAPLDVTIYNPAFDVTPNELVTALITDQGVLYPPFDVKIENLSSEVLVSNE